MDMEIKSHAVHFLVTDCHNTASTSRPKRFLMARESLRLKHSDSPVPDRSTPEHTVYVSLSRYTDLQKQQYTEMPKTGKNIYKKLDEVVGKHSDDEGNVFYFARYQEGIVERVRR